MNLENNIIEKIEIINDKDNKSNLNEENYLYYLNKYCENDNMYTKYILIDSDKLNEFKNKNIFNKYNTYRYKHFLKHSIKKILNYNKTNISNENIKYLNQNDINLNINDIDLNVLDNKTTKLNIKILKYLKCYMQLSKFKLTTWITLSSTFGYFMLGGSPYSIELCSLILGVFLCSSSANTFNQIIEKDIDVLMHRTKKRPLPNNNISLNHAKAYGILTAALGSAILFYFNNALTSYLALLNIFLYTCIYTPLKLKTPYNTHIGSIVGSIPTLMGCTTIDNNLYSIEAWVLFCTQFLWQFPHFYSLAYLYKEDYIKGNYKMFPLNDKNGFYTAKICKPYIITISLLPVIFYSFGYTSYMYILTSLIPNLFINYKFLQFYKNPTKKHIRSFFKHSLWQIILLLGLTAYHTQIPDKNEKGENDKFEQGVTKFKKKFLKYCIVFS